MRGHTIKKRTRFFLAVEGESEQSFVKWLQVLSDEKRLHVHLDSIPLGGGGFKSMLSKSLRFHKKRCQIAGAYRERILIVDADRAERGDWSIETLRAQAAKHNIIVCLQSPNHEGLLLKMMQGMEHEKPDASTAVAKLKNRWRYYQKPMNAQMLARQFSFEDLLRASSIDADLKTLLQTIGFIPGLKI
jgi:hypothetical protein